MALKELRRSANQRFVQTEEKVEKFTKSDRNTIALNIPDDNDHRLTLRIPKWLIDRVDAKRKERIGKISRNLWILETIEKAAKN